MHRHFGADYEAIWRASEPPEPAASTPRSCWRAIIEHYAPAREMVQGADADPARLRAILDEGAERIRPIAQATWPRSANGWPSLVARQGWREGECTTSPVLPDAIPRATVQQLGTRRSIVLTDRARAYHLDVSPCEDRGDDTDQPSTADSHTAPASLATALIILGTVAVVFVVINDVVSLVAYFNDVIMIFFLAWCWPSS